MFAGFPVVPGAVKDGGIPELPEKPRPPDHTAAVAAPAVGQHDDPLAGA